MQYITKQPTFIDSDDTIFKTNIASIRVKSEQLRLVHIPQSYSEKNRDLVGVEPCVIGLLCQSPPGLIGLSLLQRYPLAHYGCDKGYIG